MISKKLGIIFITLLVSVFLTIGCVEDTNESNDDEINSGLLTIRYGDYRQYYSLEELIDLENYSGTGRSIKTKLLPDSIVLTKINEYNGVSIPTLLNEIPNLPDNYNVDVISEDGWSITFSKDETLGYVEVYNESGEIIISDDSIVMLLAYMENGLFYSELDPENIVGPLRTAFVGDDVITSSNLWSRKVVFIEVIPL
jgi:hypothetical protein